jgi:hypothetical protein
MTAGFDYPAVTPPAKWRSAGWENLPLIGIPSGTNLIGHKYALDGGSGERLYWRMLGSIGRAMYRFDGASWTVMPGFWPEQQRYPTWSARLWGSERIIGETYWAEISVYTGSGWHAFGAHNSPSGSTQIAIGYKDHAGDALYIMSDFQHVNGIPARGFARFDGTNWSAPWPELVDKGFGIADAVIYDDGSGPAIFTNSTTTLNGLIRQGLHKWDGTTWSFIGGPETDPWVIAEIWDLQVFDDGRGPALYIGGSFHNFGGVVTENLVRYSGQGFEAVGGGVITRVKALGVVQDNRGLSLWVQGQHPLSTVNVAGGTAYGLAQWVGCKLPTCYANCDLSTTAPTLNANDFMCFLNRYVVKDPYANCNVNASIDIADFICFLNKFAAGCN